LPQGLGHRTHCHQR